jgi:hypothetical protein
VGLILDRLEPSRKDAQTSKRVAAVALKGGSDAAWSRRGCRSWW